MHDIRSIRDNPEAFDAGLGRRGLGPASPRLMALDEQRRVLIGRTQAMQERRNAASREVGQAKAAKDEARAQALIAEVGALKVDLPAAERELAALDEALKAVLAEIPNIPAEDVPEGRDEHGNVLLKTWSTPRKASHGEHFVIGEALGLMDFETAAKLSGARFVVLKGPLARLERALAQFMLDLHTEEHGYVEVAPPLLVRDAAMFGTAQLPKFFEDQFPTNRDADAHLLEAAFHGLAKTFDDLAAEGTLRPESVGYAIREVFKINRTEAERSRLWLIPTAEVPLTNLVRESILAEEDLPLRFTAATPCFRAEAGAAGRDTRGMIRQHQFNKVEMVSVTTPETADDEHERMLGCAEAVLQKLDLPYRVMTLCTGDMGFSARKTYDLEVWLPGQNAYREISSCSACGDFQARRMDARFRPADGRGTRFVHTLNGSGVAVGRALVAVLENYVQEGGSVAVPSVLVPYMGGITTIERAV